ncbi:MAG: outer membrane lipoprotein carrier protein LolA [Bacteroidetes bacterium]|nr:outer membrane lipoprotein carrier protein LolA [Bacteroidota bacterium]MBS1972709.1 outer membrane lipoprotein carrier protein LolA [Bacteroidota bacterium]
MKKILITALFFSGLSIVNAQNNSLGNNDPAAKKILDQVSAKAKSYKSIKADFTLEIQNAAGKTEGSKKGIVYLKGTQYHISITGQEIFCDGKNLWTYDKSTNEVTINKIDPTVKTITPEKFFTNFYDKDFLYKLNGESKQGNKTMQEIELTPVDKTKTFFKVYLYVDKAAKMIHGLKSLEKNGSKDIVTINKLVGNTTISDDLFVFNKAKYPGVEEVDLRE